MSKLKILMITLPSLFVMVQTAVADCRTCGAKHATSRHVHVDDRPLASSIEPVTLHPGVSVDLPVGANPGECFARVARAPQFETTTEQIVTREASERIEVIPAVYETVSEQVLVKPASSYVTDVPGQFERVEEQVLVSPARTEWQYVACEKPVVKRTASCDRRGRNRRRHGESYHRSNDQPTATSTSLAYSSNMRLCLVDIPAKYETVSRVEMTVPPSERLTEQPAQYKTVTRQVVKTPARELRVAIPVEYGTISRQVMVADARSEWQQIDCRSGANVPGWNERAFLSTTETGATRVTLGR